MHGRRFSPAHVSPRAWLRYERGMTERRSCTHQQSSGLAVSLTPRDKEVLVALARYPYLRAPYLHAFAGGRSEKRFVERLGLLFHEGYVDRPSEQWTLPDARRRPALYEIGRRSRGAGTDEARTFLGHGARGQIEHSALLCAVIASFEIGCREIGTVRFIPWPEIRARAPGAPEPFRLSGPDGAATVPDGVFGLEYSAPAGPHYRFFALEADRGTMPISRAGAGTSLMEKFKRYETLVAHGASRRQLGVSNLIVLTVTTSEARALEIVRRAGDALHEPGRFLCMAVAERELDRPAPALLSAPWQRFGLPAVTLSRVTSTQQNLGC